jgi:hypothetical protein
MSPRRSLVWWLKWVFASWGLTVALLMVLYVVLLPMLGAAAASETMLSNRGVLTAGLIAVGAFVSYRFLK